VDKTITGKLWAGLCAIADSTMHVLTLSLFAYSHQEWFAVAIGVMAGWRWLRATFMLVKRVKEDTTSGGLDQTIFLALTYGPTLLPVYALQECFLTTPLAASNWLLPVHYAAAASCAEMWVLFLVAVLAPTSRSAHDLQIVNLWAVAAVLLVATAIKMHVFWGVMREEKLGQLDEAKG
jgi:hypothetical protein